MRIAVIAPLSPVPSVGYGPIETVVHDLTEGLVLRGHEVILFASAGSRSRAILVPHLEAAPDPALPVVIREALFERVGRVALAKAIEARVDVIHDHIYAAGGSDRIPTLHTVHGFPADELVGHLTAIGRSPGSVFNAISRRQRDLLLESNSELPVMGAVHHGLDFSGMPVEAEKDDHYLFLGRASPEKGPDLAIAIAREAGVKLFLALRARLPAEKRFLDTVLRPLAERAKGTITLLQEASAVEKFELMRRARGVLFTSRWEEPFGLVMIEAMACGTPVFALRRGSAPEVIVDGVTGFLSGMEGEMPAAILRAGEIDPRACRAHVDRWFSAARMVEDYERLYEEVAGDGS